MAVDPITGSSSGSTAGTRQQLATNFDTFLTLLTTQLQHQDPLSPLDSTEFVQQLVSFTEVEQSINGNQKLDTLIDLLSANQGANAVAYLGRVVEAEGDTAVLRDGQATFTYDLAAKAQSNVVTVKNAKGDIVYTGQVSNEPGRHVFVWNGRDNNGIVQPVGDYTVSFKAKDRAGATIPVTTTFVGKVIAVDQGADGMVLDVDGNKLPLSSILAVLDPSELPQLEQEP